jgi:uridine phosphorylase
LDAGDEPIITPDVFHLYTAKRHRMPPRKLTVPRRMVITFHRSTFEAVRRRIRGRYLGWYYERRLAVGSVGGTGVCVLHSFIGSPGATTMLEEMIAAGADKVVEVGLCGGMARDAKVGDIFLAEEAFSDEGTSLHYFGSGPRRFAASKGLSAAVENRLKESGTPFKKGAVWTTDAPYRETKAKFRSYLAKGASGVNMESSALFALAKYRGIEIASIQLVSDLLRVEGWKPGFHRDELAARSADACRLAVDALVRA